MNRWVSRSNKFEVLTSPRDVLLEIRKSLPREYNYTPIWPDPLRRCLDAIVETLADDIQHGKSILLWGDYDVDGTCSILIWLYMLRHIKYPVFDYYIPTRDQGYGLSVPVLKERGAKYDTIITMDNGMTAREASEWCHEQGIKLIVTDHHSFEEDERTTAEFVLNPKEHPECYYSQLCGAGITLHLVIELLTWIDKHDEHTVVEKPMDLVQDLYFLAALGTVCDAVPLVDANRYILKEGFKAWEMSRNPAFEALRFAKNLGKILTADDIAFSIGPLINACGRLDSMEIVIKFFTAPNEYQRHQALEGMIDLVTERKEIEQNMMAEVERKVKASDDFVFAGQATWSYGVLGIAATRIAEKHQIPALLFTSDGYGRVLRGSARCFDGVKLLSIMKEKAEFFVTLGGHEQAFGFSFMKKMKDKIRSHLRSRISEVREKQPGLFLPRLEYNCSVDPRILTLRLAKKLNRMEPFGRGYPKPVFKIEGHVYRCQLMGMDRNHTALYLKYDGNIVKVMFFFKQLEFKGTDVQALVDLSVNKWKGKEELLVRGIDIIETPSPN